MAHSAKTTVGSSFLRSDFDASFGPAADVVSRRTINSYLAGRSAPYPVVIEK